MSEWRKRSTDAAAVLHETRSDSEELRRGGRDLVALSAGMDQRLLRLTTEFKRSDAVEFPVADSGPGIDAEMADCTFDPFVATKRGMGIGLSVCHSIIETHGRSLRFEANPGGGTIFSFPLLAAPSEGAEDAE
jgi:C4-dicarboxylate-specific signal transduction histidine kinase